MSIRNEDLYERFLEVFNTISERHNLLPTQYNRIEHDFLLHLISDNKGYAYNEILGTISELLTVYGIYQRYIDHNELFDTIARLLRSEYNF